MEHVIGIVRHGIYVTSLIQFKMVAFMLLLQQTIVKKKKYSAIIYKNYWVEKVTEYLFPLATYTFRILSAFYFLCWSQWLNFVAQNKERN